MDYEKLPQIESLAKITPKQFEMYVRFVSAMRFQQRRYFNFRKPDALQTAKDMEADLDKLNAYLLDPTPKLF